MKRVILAVHIVVLAFVLVCMPQVLSKTKNVYYLDKENSQETFNKETREEVKKQMLNLQFKGENLPYDAESYTFFLPLSMQNEEWEAGGLATDNAKISIVFEDEIATTDKLQDIADNKSFTFVAYDDKEYCYYHLVFTGLPMMDITIKEDTIEGQAVIDMSLYDSENKINWVQSSLATFAVRGATSRNFPKLSFKIKLFEYDKSGEPINNDLRLLDMRKDNDWILYAMYNDETKVRDKLSIDLWNEFGAKDNSFQEEYGTKLEYVELIVNDDYYGIYGLMEPVDAKKLNIDQASEESKQEYIYKRTDNHGLELAEFSEDSSALKRCGFELKGAANYGEISLKTWQPLIDMIEVQSEEDDERYAKKITSVIDTNSAMNTWLFLQIVSGHDNEKKNMYYVAKNTYEGTKLFFVPWDLDLTWGMAFNQESSLFSKFDSSMLTKEINWETGQRLIETNADNSVTKVNNKWKDLRNTLLSDQELMKRIKELEDTVVYSGAMQRETVRWPEGGHTVDFTELEQFALGRMNYLDTYFEELVQSVKE